MTRRAAVVGAGPAGLFAAETLAERGVAVDLFEAMASPGRKLLIAGRGGLNLTHSEPVDRFAERYGAQAGRMRRLLAAFGPDDLRAWAAGLGVETFIGSSGRVFPLGMQAGPLLRAWVRQLRGRGVGFHLRHRWLGWDDRGRLRFTCGDGEAERIDAPDAVVLALGGASWPQLGSDGAWVPILAAEGQAVAPLRPANCGFDVEGLSPRWAGQRLSTVTLSFGGETRRGEITLTATGIEGGLVYALSAALRDAIEAQGTARPTLDLLPDWPIERVRAALSGPRRARSGSTFLKKALPLGPAALGVLVGLGPYPLPEEAHALARLVKALPLPLLRPRPIAEAISTAGGLCFDDLGDDLMLRHRPGCFAAGEMLDWEAPTGGYLLSGCFATGRAAALGAAGWVERRT